MDDFEKFYNKSLRFLSFRPRSEKEVKDNLKRKKAGSLVIDKVIIKLKEKKFINDLEFAKWWVEQRTSFKPRGLRLIKIELRQKGISQEIIEEIISNDEFLIPNDLEQAGKLVEKRMKRFRNKFGMTREEIYQKLGGVLARRGFDWETIKQAIDEAFAKVV
ncbi:MAG: RecX family transcriptional regulator [bacterium]|nr:RecX family transcriptional regulator [bacterium]